MTIRLLMLKASNKQLPARTYFPALSLLKFVRLLNNKNSQEAIKQIVGFIERHSSESNTLILLTLYFTYIQAPSEHSNNVYSSLFISLYQSLEVGQFIFLSTHLPLIPQEILSFLKEAVSNGVLNREKESALKALTLIQEIILNRKDIRAFKMLLKMNLLKQIKISEYVQTQITNTIVAVQERGIFETATILHVVNDLIKKHPDYPKKLFISVTEKIPRFLALYYNFYDFETNNESSKFIKKKLGLYMSSFKTNNDLKSHLTDSFKTLSLTKIFVILYWVTAKGTKPLENYVTNGFLQLMKDKLPLYFRYLLPDDEAKELLLKTNTLLRIDTNVIGRVFKIIFEENAQKTWKCEKVGFISRFITQQETTDEFDSFVKNYIIKNDKIFPIEDIAKALKITTKSKVIPKRYMRFVFLLVSEGSNKLGFLEDCLCEMVSREFWKGSSDEWGSYIKIIDKLGTTGFYSVGQLPDVLNKELLAETGETTRNQYKDFIAKYY